MIAGAVGYADPAAFRRIYRKHTGETPTATRTRRNSDGVQADSAASAAGAAGSR